MGVVQQSWQKNLSAHINIQQIPMQQMESNLLSGSYEIMLLPFTPQGPRIESLLSAFTSRSSQNYFGYQNPRYDQLLSQALDEESFDVATTRYVQAEKTLLADAVVIPVYGETSWYATGKGVEGVEVFPFGGRIEFKYGVKS